MKILIIRHAEPNYAANCLTEKGYREADFLGEKLKDMNITDVYCSPFNRAIQTAEAMAKKTGHKIKILDWLSEFPGKIISDNGEKIIPWNLEPRIWSDRELLYDIHSWDKDSLLNSYTTGSTYKSIVNSFDGLLDTYGYKRHNNVIYTCDNNKDITIAFFCHFALGMTLISHLSGISPILLWQSMFLPTSSVSQFITEERVKGEVVFKCMQLGDTSHLFRMNEPISNSGLFPEFFGGTGCGPQV